MRTFALEVAANPLPGFTAGTVLPRYPLNREVDQALLAPAVLAGTTPVRTFVVEPALPAGLRYKPPTETVAKRLYTLPVADSAGNVAVTKFTLAPRAEPAATEEDPPLRYALTPTLPAGLNGTAPARVTAFGPPAGGRWRRMRWT